MGVLNVNEFLNGIGAIYITTPLPMLTIIFRKWLYARSISLKSVKKNDYYYFLFISKKTEAKRDVVTPQGYKTGT